MMKHQDIQETAILIVDDEPGTVRELGVFLEGLGFQILGAQSGEQALKLVEQVKPRPEIILLDVRMPAGIGGFETCRQLKKNETTKDIPVIFLSALHETTDKVQGFDVGGVDYITKPFDRNEVLARVNAHLTIRRLQQQLQALANAPFEGIAIYNKNNRNILLANQQIVDMFGYEVPDEIHGQKIDTFVENFPGNEHPFETRGFRKDGSSFLIEIQEKMMPYEKNETKVVAIRELTWLERSLKKAKTQDPRERFGEIIGRSAVMNEVYERILSASVWGDFGVLILGETGTGKELVAREIHNNSNRASNHFIPVNCGAISENLFESEFFGHRKGAFTGADRDKCGFFEKAHGGTLFLDEITELKPLLQVKLLRALQDKEYTPVGDTESKKVDVRIVAATNKDFKQLLQEGSIRDDFYHRVSVLKIKLPPLRERQEDIPLLIEYFLEKFTNKKEFHNIPARTKKELCTYYWPGNIRELQNVLKRYVAKQPLELGDITTAGCATEIPRSSFGELEEEIITVLRKDFTKSSFDIREFLDEVEKLFISYAKEQTKTKRAAARILGLHENTYRRKAQDFGILT